MLVLTRSTRVRSMRRLKISGMRYVRYHREELFLLLVQFRTSTYTFLEGSKGSTSSTPSNDTTVLLTIG